MTISRWCEVSVSFRMHSRLAKRPGFSDVEVSRIWFLTAEERALVEARLGALSSPQDWRPVGVSSLGFSAISIRFCFSFSHDPFLDGMVVSVSGRLRVSVRRFFSARNASQQF